MKLDNPLADGNPILRWGGGTLYLDQTAILYCAHSGIYGGILEEDFPYSSISFEMCQA